MSPVTVVEHEVAVRADGTLYVTPMTGAQVYAAHRDRYGWPLDLTEIEGRLRQDAHTGQRATEWLGDIAWQGERWQVYAEVSFRWPGIVRFIAYPVTDGTERVLVGAEAVAR